MISILVTAFSRPDLLQKCIISILNQGIDCEIFLHLDGPKNREEYRLTQECLKVFLNIDHPNLIFSQYESHSQNLGCKASMWCALDWFFSQRSKGLILEDDVVILPGALSVTKQFLEEYECDSTIAQISLSNQISRKNSSEVSYYLSNYPFIWGWATWRDRWESNIEDISQQIQLFLTSKHATEIRDQIGKRAFDYWIRRFESATKSQIDTWDFQWHFTNWFYNRKTIHFDRIFSINIGFDSRATHTKVALKLDLVNQKLLTQKAKQIDQIKLRSMYFASLMDKKISSKVFGIPHWLFHPLKFGKKIIDFL